MNELTGGSDNPERWHTVTTDSATIYVWDDFKGETAKSRAQAFARDIGAKADYHQEGSVECEVWGCMAHLEPLYDANLRNTVAIEDNLKTEAPIERKGPKT